MNLNPQERCLTCRVWEAYDTLFHSQLDLYRQELLEEIEGKKRKLIEPVTKRVVADIGDKVGIDLDADTKGSLVFIQDNGFNQALDEVKAIIEKGSV